MRAKYLFRNITKPIHREFTEVIILIIEVIKVWTVIDLNDDTDSNSFLALKKCYELLHNSLDDEDIFNNEYVGPSNRSNILFGAFKNALEDITIALRNRKQFSRRTCFPPAIQPPSESIETPPWEQYM